MADCSQLACIDDAGCITPIEVGQQGQTIGYDANGDLVWQTIDVGGHDPLTLAVNSNPALILNVGNQVANLNLNAAGSFNNGPSGLASNSVQGALTELAGCRVCSIVSANNCTGGIGPTFAIRTASRAAGVLTLNGAPEHTTASVQQQVAFANIAIPGDDGTVVQQLTATLTNPSACRSMRYLAVIRPGRIGAVMSPGNRWQWMLTTTTSDGAVTPLGVGTLARYDTRGMMGVGMNFATPAGSEVYTGTIAPGGNVTYTYQVQFDINDQNLVGGESANIGQGYITIFGSTI